MQTISNQCIKYIDEISPQIWAITYIIRDAMENWKSGVVDNTDYVTLKNV